MVDILFFQVFCIKFLKLFSQGKGGGKKGEFGAGGPRGPGAVLGIEWGGRRGPSTGAPPFFRNEWKRSLER